MQNNPHNALYEPWYQTILDDVRWAALKLRDWI
jgi:hypothetical protein